LTLIININLQRDAYGLYGRIDRGTSCRVRSISLRGCLYWYLVSRQSRIPLLFLRSEWIFLQFRVIMIDLI